MRAILFALVIAMSASDSLASIVTGPIYNPANGHNYYLLSVNTWTASEAEAVSLGGHLVTINDAAEQQLVFSTVANFDSTQRLIWIGLNDATTEGQFQWTSGEPVTYTNWAPGEPNNSGGGEDYVAMYYPNHSEAGKWNDWNDRTHDPIGIQFNGVAEVVPEPSTTIIVSAALLAASLLSRSAFRRRWA